MAININTCYCSLTYATQNVVGNNNCNNQCTGAGQTTNTCGGSAGTILIRNYFSYYTVNQTTFFTNSTACQASYMTSSNAIMTGVRAGGTCNCNSGYVLTTVNGVRYCDPQTNALCAFNTSTGGYTATPAYLNLNSVALSQDTLRANIINTGVDLLINPTGSFVANRSVTANFGSPPQITVDTLCGTAGNYIATKSIVNCYDNYALSLPFSTYITTNTGKTNCGFQQTNFPTYFRLTNTLFVSSYDLLINNQQFGFYPVRNTVSSYGISLLLPYTFNTSTVANVTTDYDAGRVITYQSYNVANSTLSLIFTVQSFWPYVVQTFALASTPSAATLLASNFVNNYTTTCTAGQPCVQSIFTQYAITTCSYTGNYNLTLVPTCLQGQCANPNGTVSALVAGDNACASISTTNGVVSSLTLYSNGQFTALNNVFRQGSILYISLLISANTAVTANNLNTFSIMDAAGSTRTLFANGNTTPLGQFNNFLILYTGVGMINISITVQVGSDSSKYLVQQSLDTKQLYTLQSTVNMVYSGINTQSLHASAETTGHGNVQFYVSNQRYRRNRGEDAINPLSRNDWIGLWIGLLCVAFLIGAIVGLCGRKGSIKQRN